MFGQRLAVPHPRLFLLALTPELVLPVASLRFLPGSLPFGELRVPSRLGARLDGKYFPAELILELPGLGVRPSAISPSSPSTTTCRCPDANLSYFGMRPG